MYVFVSSFSKVYYFSLIILSHSKAAKGTGKNLIYKVYTLNSIK